MPINLFRKLGEEKKLRCIKKPNLKVPVYTLQFIKKIIYCYNFIILHFLCKEQAPHTLYTTLLNSITS